MGTFCKIFVLDGEKSEDSEGEINMFLHRLTVAKCEIIQILQSSTNKTLVGIGFYPRTFITIFYRGDKQEPGVPKR